MLIFIDREAGGSRTSHSHGLRLLWVYSSGMTSDERHVFSQHPILLLYLLATNNMIDTMFEVHTAKTSTTGIAAYTKNVFLPYLNHGMFLLCVIVTGIS